MVKKRGRSKTKTVSMGGKAYVCKPTMASRAKYKKCILSAIRGTKITTRKGAQKAFAKASKKCRAVLSGKAPAKRKGRKRAKTRFGLVRRGKSRSSGLMGYTGGRPLWMG